MGFLKAQGLTALLAMTGTADAFWRMPCRSRTGLARIDPLMNPGEIADHVHAIHGGGDFGMSTKAEDLKSSSCTSCEVTQDKSAYWTPSLHFMYPNGTTVVVPQVGGMLAYYLLYTDSSDYSGNITAFPEGFNMISGDKNIRNFTWPVPDPPKSDWSGDQVSQLALGQKALGFNCLNYAAAPEGSLYRHFLPDKNYLDSNCLDGIRLELMFPSCWNGKDVDSPDHRSHVAFPDLVMTGTCPPDFPVKLPSLFYETIWNTYAFNGVDGEFVLSHGDPTGYGYHGDFMMGWDSSDFLQQAVDTCTDLSGLIQDCSLFDIQSDDTAAQCTFDMPEVLADDDAAGPVQGLPMSVPIQSGPGYATWYPVVTAGGAAPATTPASSQSASAVVPTLTYQAATTTLSDGILRLKASTSSTASASISISATSASTESSSSTSSASASPASVDSSTPTSTQASSASSVVSIQTTAAPTLTASASTGSVVSTLYVTETDEVVEIVIEEVVVTVTASEPVARVKRHMDDHRAARSRRERRERR